MKDVVVHSEMQTGLAYSLETTDNHVMLAYSELPVAADAVSAEVAVFKRTAELRTSPPAGWFKHTARQQAVASLSVATPVWEAPLMALGVVSAIALAMAVLSMLVQKHFHKTLLQVSNPVICLMRIGPFGFGTGDRNCPLNDEDSAQTVKALAVVFPNGTHPRRAGAVQSMLPVKTLPFVERGLNFCERFEVVTILFSDIISFTNMAAVMDPLSVVNMLNELYCMYDGLVDKHHVYKVRRKILC